MVSKLKPVRQYVICNYLLCYIMKVLLSCRMSHYQSPYQHHMTQVSAIESAIIVLVHSTCTVMLIIEFAGVAIWITALVVLVLVTISTVFIVLNLSIAIYIRKRGECRRRVDKPENDNQQQPPLTYSGDPTTSDSVISQDDKETVTSRLGISRTTVVRKNERSTSFSRDIDGNGVPGVTDNTVLDTSTSLCIPLNYSFDHLHRENERYDDVCLL